MPRSSFSRSPLLRVSRPVSACSRCRSAKVKCDGKLPACTACERAGRENECSAANDQFARGKERSYVAALELRIEKLERRLDYAKSRKASVGQHDVDGHNYLNLTEADRRNSLAVIRAAIHRKAARNRENSDVNSLVSDFSILSVDATTRDFAPTLGNITFARLAMAAIANDPLPEVDGSCLPSRQSANAIIQFFMQNIYSLFPCFSETALLTIVDDVYRPSQTTVDDVYRQDGRMIKDSDYWLLYLVLAIGSTAQSRKHNDEHYRTGVSFISKATAYAEKALTPGYVTQIQSLLLLTLYSMLDPAHFDTWHLIGLTANAVIDLGLHQDPPSSPVSDRAALDLRRKIFYCTYSIDRAIALTHARTFSFADDSINVAFPHSLSLGDKQAASRPISGPQSGDSALLLFQLRRAQSYWYQVLHQSEPTPLQNPTAFLWQMCLDMREWQESLPDSLPPSTRQMFEQELRYSYVYCLAPSARAPQINDYIRVLMFEYCMEYLLLMYDIARGGLNTALYTYHDALKVYFMANQFLAVLRDAREVLLFGAQMPPPPTPAGSAPPPPIPRGYLRAGLPVESNSSRTLRCLERIPETLQIFGMRWENALKLKQNFEQMSKDVVQQLQILRQTPGMVLNGVQNHFHNDVQAMSAPGLMRMTSDLQSRGGMRWAGVEAAHLVQRGPR